MKTLPKTTFFLITLLITSLPFSTLALALVNAGSISKSDCVSFDNNKKMGPVRDQRSNGLCWAFAGAALMEEEICFQKNKVSCNDSVSPLDASRCKWKVGDKNQGGLTRYALNCALQNGVCLEQDAPYSKNVDVDLT